MSGSDEARCDEARRRARIDREERAKGREAAAARREAAAAAKAQAKRAEELRLLDEVKAAQRAGKVETMPKGKAKPRFKAGNAPVLGTRTVDDPLEPGAKLKATVNLAEHPLEMMLARRRLAQDQYEAGVRFRAIYERSVIGPGRGIDPGKIKVDGGRIGDPLSDAVINAQFELKRLARELGPIGERIVSAVCGSGETVSSLAKRWPSPDAERARLDYLTIRLREALDHLAERVWGARGPERGVIVGERGMGSDEIDERAIEVANQTYLRRRGIAL